MAPRENTAPAPVIDRMFHAWLARLTLGLSPAALMQAYLDWLVHFTISPGKQAELAQNALRKAIRFTLYAAKKAHKPNSTCCIEPFWEAWLTQHSSEQVPPPAVGTPEKNYFVLCNAPGTYVLEE